MGKLFRRPKVVNTVQADTKTAEAIREQNTIMKEQNQKVEEEKVKSEDLRKQEYVAKKKDEENQAEIIVESDKINQAQRKPKKTMDTSLTDDELDIQWLDDPTKKKVK